MFFVITYTFALGKEIVNTTVDEFLLTRDARRENGEHHKEGARIHGGKQAVCVCVCVFQVPQLSRLKGL